MKKVIMSAVVAVICGGQAYAGSLEGERVNSGVRFGETAMTDEAQAVRMNGDFRAAPKAALTAAVRQERAAVPAVSADRSAMPDLNNASTAVKIGATIGGVLGGLAGFVGAAIVTAGLISVIGLTLGVIVGIPLIAFAFLKLGKMGVKFGASVAERLSAR